MCNCGVVEVAKQTKDPARCRGFHVHFLLFFSESEANCRSTTYLVADMYVVDGVATGLPQLARLFVFHSTSHCHLTAVHEMAGSARGVNSAVGPSQHHTLLRVFL